MGFCFEQDENKYSFGGLMALVHRWGKGNLQIFLEGVSQSEFCLMFGLYYNLGQSGEVGIRNSDLVKKFNVSAPAISRMLGNLERRGLVLRYMRPKDKRNSYVRLTEAGEHVTVKSMQRLSVFFEQVIERMGQENFQQMVDLMYCFNDSMEEVIKVRREEEKVNV